MRLISKTLCCAGQVLPVLAWSGLLDVREREGGGWRLHRPRGLHHTQVLYPICKCFYLCWVPKVPSCAAVQPETCALWTFLILSAFVNVASLFPASQRCRQDPQTCHPAPLHQLAWLWSSLLTHWHVEVPQKGQGHQPSFLWACRGPLQVLNGLVVSRHVLPVRVHLSETFALSCVPTRTDVSLFGCCRLRTRSRQLSVAHPLFGCVVCPRSAGVGRTGTFIVIDAMIEMMHAEQKVDVFGFVSKIRSQRSQLVQTDVSAPPPRVSPVPGSQADTCVLTSDAVLIHLPGSAWILPLRRHRAGCVVSRRTPAQTAQHLRGRRSGRPGRRV